MKKKLLTILQFLLAGGLIAFFVYQMDKKGQIGIFAEALKSAAANPHLLIPGVSLFAICLALCNWRWKILLAAQGVNLSFGRSMMLYMIGQFFSSFMPGATSGDLFKAIYIARESPDKKTEAVATVFIDRIIGLLALIGLTSVVTLARLDFFLSNPKTKGVMIFNVILLAGMAAGIAVVFGQNVFEKIPLFKKLEEKTSLGKIISKVYSAFHICIKSPAVLIKTICLSAVNHLTFIFIAVLIGMSIGVEIPITDYLTVFPIINAIAAVPLTPGGLGTRDAAAVFMLGLLGIAEPVALSISILVYLATIFWSAVGGGVYLFYIAKQGKPKLSETELD
jgi:uncharacterized protein (TIRG00374 family)